VLYSEVLQPVAQQEQELIRLLARENETRDMVSGYLNRQTVNPTIGQQNIRVTRQTNSVVRRLLQYMTDDDTTITAIEEILRQPKLKLSYFTFKENRQLLDNVYRQLTTDACYFGLTMEKTHELFMEALHNLSQSDMMVHMNINTWNAMYQRLMNDQQRGQFIMLSHEEYKARLEEELGKDILPEDLMIQRGISTAVLSKEIIQEILKLMKPEQELETIFINLDHLRAIRQYQMKQ
jgi:hypothetical protein